MGGEHHPEKCEIGYGDKDGVGDQTHMALPGARHPSGLGFLKGSNNSVLPQKQQHMNMIRAVYICYMSDFYGVEEGKEDYTHLTTSLGDLQPACDPLWRDLLNLKPQGVEG